MFPVYGLAEATVAVTFSPPGSGIDVVAVDREALAVGAPARIVDAADAKAMRLVKVGIPSGMSSCDFATTPERALAEGTVGHVQIRGDNVTIGYYEGTEGEGVVFTEDGWLDTGDVGFVHEGELVITGRAKEIIFFAGQNHFPQDLEALLESMPEIGLGKVAVCGVRPPDAPADEVVAFVLHRKGLDEFMPIAHAVRIRITEGAGLARVAGGPGTADSEDHQRQAAAFPAARPLSRRRIRRSHRRARGPGASSRHADAHPAGAIEQQLLEITRKLIPGREIGVDDNIFELGTSSLVLAQIHEQIEEKWPNQLAITDFFDYPTIGEARGLSRVTDRSGGRGLSHPYSGFLYFHLL